MRRFDTGSMNANKLVRQLRREAMANPKKAAVLGLLLLAGAYYWGPLLWSWTASGRASGEPAGEKSIASTATAPAALAQTSTTEPDALLSDKNPSHPWSQLDEWIRQDPATSPAKDLAGWRNPFAVAPSTQAATDAREQAQPERTQVTPESLGIELSGTAVGPLRRVAMIGGTAFREGQTIKIKQNDRPIEFRLVEVHLRRIVLEREGDRFDLAIPERETAGRIEPVGLEN